MKKLLFILFLLSTQFLQAQVKILFDATKAESAGNADWVIDADQYNLGYSNGPAVPGQGSEANAQRIPTPAQSGITSSTTEGYWTGALSAWGVDLVKKGYTVETLPYNCSITYGNTGNPQDLSNYKVFIMDEPNIKLTSTEKTAILQFVQNGGGLYWISDHAVSDRNNDGWDSQMISKDFFFNNTVQSDPFGISVDSADFSGTYNYVANLPGDPLLHGVMGDVTQVKWSGGTSLTLSPTANSSVKGVVYKTSNTTGNTNCLVAYATYGSGKIVVMGDSSPTDDGTGDTGDQLYDGWITDAAGNHERLIINATIWLATSTGTVSVTGVTLNPTTLSLTVGGNASQLTASIIPSNATNQNVSWTSNHTNIATVSSSGLVTPVAAGTCTVTVTTTDGNHTATCNVTVTNPSGIAGISAIQDVNIYPNPASENLYIETGKMPVNTISIKILSTIGNEVKLMQRTETNSKLSYDISNLSNGIYFVVLEYNGKKVVRKFSVIRN